MADLFARFKKWVIVEEPSKEEEEAEVWPSRFSFILASMGGAVGVGNLIRYPSIALKNHGLQWFIPYVGSLLLVGLPILALEISIGQAYRSGNVLAFNRLHKRLRGVGLSAVFLGFVASTYYVVIMSWVMTFFRYSFQNPLPWKGRTQSFFHENVHRSVRGIEPTAGSGGFVKYNMSGMVWEIFGWTLLTWIFVYLSLWKGVKGTGKVVYITMLMPLVTCVAILIRALTLENAGRGVKLYVGSWFTHKLMGGQIWKEAMIQVFYSVGTGFGIFTAYASHNPRDANVIQDVTIIACGNSLIEMGAAFAAFGVIGYLGLDVSKLRLNSFEVGFITYPEALANLPGANVWAVVFFITLYLLGIDSAFAYLEGLTTAVANTNWGCVIRQKVAVFGCVLIAFLCSIVYTTKFGYGMLNAMDTQVTQIALILSVWMECVGSTTLYRHKEVISQTGVVAFAIAQGTYFGSQILGVMLGHSVKPNGPWAGLGIWLSVLIVGQITAALVSKKPEVIGLWGPNKFLNSLYYLTSYSGHILAQDLNQIVAQRKNWSLPPFWAPLLRWFAAPILMTILSLGYSDFVKNNSNDPLHIFSFVIAHLFVVMLALSIIVPNSLNIFIRDHDRDADAQQYLESVGEPIPYDKVCPPKKDVEDANVASTEMGYAKVAEEGADTKEIDGTS